MSIREMIGKTGFGVAVAITCVGVSACELTYDVIKQSRQDCSVVYHAGCPIETDFTAQGDIRNSPTTAQRQAIIEHAEAAPHRQCDNIALGCQASQIVDVIADSYIDPLR